MEAVGENVEPLHTRCILTIQRSLWKRIHRCIFAGGSVCQIKENFMLQKFHNGGSWAREMVRVFVPEVFVSPPPVSAKSSKKSLVYGRI